MPLGDGRHQPLAATVAAPAAARSRLTAVLRRRPGRTCSPPRCPPRPACDLLQLQPAAVVGAHHEDAAIDQPPRRTAPLPARCRRSRRRSRRTVRRRAASARAGSARCRRKPAGLAAVARLRMKTRSSCEWIIAARSPSSAPLPTMLGSWERIAMRAIADRTFRDREAPVRRSASSCPPRRAR